MSHFSGHFEGASTFLTHQKKIISRSFLNSGTLIVNPIPLPLRLHTKQIKIKLLIHADNY